MEAVFKHILVPVDFTPKNQASIVAARHLALSSDARITLLHVIEFIDYPDDDEIAGFYEKLKERSAAELERLGCHFEGDDIPVDVDTIINSRCRGIAVYAAENDVDLIVMNSHPIRPDQKSESWATISYQVSVLCDCSILMVKRPIEVD